MADTASVLTGGDNSFQTTAEAINAPQTDFNSPGVVGVITNTSGIAPMTGALAVNAQGTPDMTVAVTGGKCWVTATPTGQSSQLLRTVIATQNKTIAANSTGGTRYDWIYDTINATNANTPNTAGDNVASITISRSTSATTDDGTPPSFGTLLAVVTVVNGAASIANSAIADRRVRAGHTGGLNDTNGNEVVKIGTTASAINEVTVTNAATGNGPTISSTGGDTNIDLNLSAKGTGTVNIASTEFSNFAGELGSATATAAQAGITTIADLTSLTTTVTVPAGGRKIKISGMVPSVSSASAGTGPTLYIYEDGAQIQTASIYMPTAGTANFLFTTIIRTPSAGSHTYKLRASSNNATTFTGSATAPMLILVEAI